MKKRNVKGKRDTKWFTDARFGMFIHWGIYSILGKGEWTLFNDGHEYSEYEKHVQQFNPKDFDPEAWAELAWNAGMRYVVFTTKHHDGFCMFDSKYTDYKVTNSPYGKDITAELINAFRKRGLKIGFYHSLVDWRHPHFIPDAEHPLWQRGERSFPGRDLKIYQEYLYNTVEQLMTDYGKIDVLFFDYTSKYKDFSEWNPERLLEMVYRLQPEILVNDRLNHEKKVLLGDYCTPEISLPNAPITLGGKERIWETCMTLNNNWGYSATDDKWKTPATVIQALVHCVCRNGNLLLNVGPDSSGKIPNESVRILREVAEWMKYASPSIHGAGMADMKAPYPHYYTQNGKKLFMHMTCSPMGDIILPEGDGLIKSASYLKDKSEVQIITHWGKELLKRGELRIRPGFSSAKSILNTIELIRD